MTYVAALLVSAIAEAIEPKEPGGGLDQKEFFLPELAITSSHARVEEVLAQLPNRAAWEAFQAARQQVGAGAVQGFVDPRSGAATNLVGAFPLIPDRGVGNAVGLEDLEARLGHAVEAVDAATVAGAFVAFAEEHRGLLAIDTAQLGAARAVQVTPDLWQINAPQVYRGVPVRDGRLAASIVQGNLVVVGTETWGDVRGLSTVPKVDAAAALDAGYAYAGGRSAMDETIAAPALEIVPVAPREHQAGGRFGGPVGAGYHHRLVWTFAYRRLPDDAVWETMVDAHSGEVIAFQDTNRYVNQPITGGVYPVTSTEICPTIQTCGTMQSGWPMPFADTGLASPNDFTNSAGIFNYTSGIATTTLTGKYVDIVTPAVRLATVRRARSI